MEKKSFSNISFFDKNINKKKKKKKLYTSNINEKA